MKYRVKIEILYLIELSYIKIIHPIKAKEKRFLNSLWSSFSLEDAAQVKEIEEQINHDVKAVEYFVKNKLEKTSLQDRVNFIHFGLTSEDTNNLAYGCLLADFLEEIYWPSFTQLLVKLRRLAVRYQSQVMVSRTHGQPASPTTLGKEMAVFIYRLKKQQTAFPKELSGKLAGAVGNFNAHVAAYPKVDWLGFAERFISKLGLEPWLVVTQIEPHDRFCELFQAITRINNILLDLSRDLWLYVSFDYLLQIPVKGEVGSSTMPHKINPIDFENAEGNLGIANALLAHFAQKLPLSRLQRDLSDSTVQRCLGVAFGHTLLSMKSLMRGLEKVTVNRTKITQDIKAHPELIAEAIQTIMRRENLPFPYEQLKKLTRGRKITQSQITDFIDETGASAKVKKAMKRVKPETYIGLSKKLARRA